MPTQHIPRLIRLVELVVARSPGDFLTACAHLRQWQRPGPALPCPGARNAVPCLPIPHSALRTPQSTPIPHSALRNCSAPFRIPHSALRTRSAPHSEIPNWSWPSPSPAHYWRRQPAADVDPLLARTHPSYAFQYQLCLRATDAPVGMLRRVPRGRWKTHSWGPISTAWFTGGHIETKRHQTIDAARKFLERKFTRTTPLRTQSPASPSHPR